MTLRRISWTFQGGMLNEGWLIDGGGELNEDKLNDENGLGKYRKHRCLLRMLVTPPRHKAGRITWSII